MKGLRGNIAAAFLLLSTAIFMAMLPMVPHAARGTPSAESSSETGSTGSEKGTDDLYAAEPREMTAAECGRCHLYHFNSLRDSGGGHRFGCQDCHKTFHAFNPRKDNFAELMPRCSGCHDLPHGNEQTECLFCHENPHAPTATVAQEKIGGRCRSCHHNAAEEMKNFPSEHAAPGCEGCHAEEHGFKPSCRDCHTPHYADQTVEECAGCHPVHRPTEISLEPETDPRTCRACHDAIYARWTNTPSGHGEIHCAACHSGHGLVPDCSDCHKAPHDPTMMARFGGCLGCHLDAHDLPVK